MGNRANLATGTVLTAPSPADSGTSLVLQSGEGALMPSTPFYATAHPDGVLPDASNAEIIQVTGVSTDTLTIVRAQKGTSAKNIAVDWRISNAVYAEEIDDLEDHVANTSNPHSVTKSQVGLGNVDNTSDATKLAATLAAIYPVGSIFISTNSSLPTDVAALGTWATFGAGRVLVGRDSGDTDFDTAEETGGAKTHTHPLSNNGGVPFGLDSDESQVIRNGPATGTTSYTNRQTGVTWGGSGTSGLIGQSLGLVGATDSDSSLQPYIVVYMWKRTA